jgi:hypothetical protein
MNAPVTGVRRLLNRVKQLVAPDGHIEVWVDGLSFANAFSHLHVQLPNVERKPRRDRGWKPGIALRYREIRQRLAALRPAFAWVPTLRDRLVSRDNEPWQQNNARQHLVPQRFRYLQWYGIVSTAIRSHQRFLAIGVQCLASANASASARDVCGDQSFPQYVYRAFAPRARRYRSTSPGVCPATVRTEFHLIQGMDPDRLAVPPMSAEEEVQASLAGLSVANSLFWQKTLL